MTPVPAGRRFPRAPRRPLRRPGRGGPTPRRRTTISTPANATHLGCFLSDGSRLVNPQQLTAQELKLNQWVALDGRAFRIINMRGVGIAGRLVELSGHAPVYVGPGATLTGFDVLPPPCVDGDVSAEPSLPAPPHVKRRRATAGAGRNAPGRRGG